VAEKPLEGFFQNVKKIFRKLSRTRERFTKVFMESQDVEAMIVNKPNERRALQMQATTTKPLMNYQQAAAYLGMRMATLYSKVSRREIPHIRLSGRMVRFDPDVLARFLRERSFTPPAPDASK
jgi:excisionase family DNA binding protein